MKTAIVPAQITTVEDKIAGNLSLSQLLLLTIPAFGGSVLYILLPPSMNMSTYKILLIAVLAAIFGLLAIRIKGKILLLWAIIMLRYSLRPRYHVFDKNDMHLRESGQKSAPEEVPAEEVTATKVESTPTLRLSTAEVVALEEIMSNPKANLHFRTDRKGALNVRITEVK
jgi:hypothetical protein